MDISRATAKVAQELIKALAILLETTARRPAVDFRGPKNRLEIRKKTFLQVINKAIIYKFLKKLVLTRERRQTMLQYLAAGLSLTFLNRRTTNETFQQSGKEDSFRHILKSSASMYSSSGLQFFRTHL